MPANPPYLPSTDADLDNWATNFSALITAAPGDYGLAAPDAVAIAAVRLTFNAALTAALDPVTRTPVTIAAKDSAKFAMLAVVRPFATQIASNAAVSNPDKTAVGVTVKVLTRTRASVVGVAVVITQDSISPTCWMIRYQNPATPTSKKLPPGAKGLSLSVTVRNATDTADEFQIQPLITRNPYNVPLLPEYAGRKIRAAGQFIGGNLEGGAPNRSEWSNTLNAICPAVP